MITRNPDTADSFPKAGDQEAEVVNVSGQPSTGLPLIARSSAVSTVPPGGPTSHRAPVEINGQTGEQFTTGIRSRARRTWAEHVDQLSGPHDRGYLSNVLGVTHPGQ